MTNPWHTYLVHYPRVVWYMKLKPALYRLAPTFWHRHSERSTKQALHTLSTKLLIDESHVAKVRDSLNTHVGTGVILEQAQRARQHRFPVLSEKDLNFGATFAWHVDPVSGFQWPDHVKYNTINFGSPPQGTDVKRLWDAARLHWLHWICFEWICTSNLKVKGTIVDELLHFIRQNPVGKGIHWAMPMEVGIRAHNILVTLALLRFDIPRAELEEIVNSLYDHLVYLVFHLEYTRHPGNHLDGNLLGLASLGLLFNASELGQRAQKLCAKHVHREVQRQLHSDGVCWEKSTSYHRLVTELLSLTLWYLPESLAIHQPSQLAAAKEFLKLSVTPDGSTPLFGDADDGRVFRVRLDCQYDVLFDGVCAADLTSCKNISDIAAVATNQVRTDDAHSTMQLHEFPDGGFAIAKSEKHHIMVDVGDYGMNGWGGHGHNDWGSFTLVAFGQPIFIDSGTGCYTEDPHLRNRLRRTAAHNTVKIRHQEHVDFAGMWRIRNEKRQYSHKVSQTTHGALVSATMSEYAKRFGVIVTRNIELTEQPNLLELSVQEVLSKVESARLFFHLDEAFQILHQSEHCVEGQIGAVSIVVECEGALTIETAVHSPSYGVTKEHSVICIDFNAVSHATKIKVRPIV